MQRLNITARMIKMRVVRRPEETIVAYMFHDMGQRGLVRVTRYPALALKIKTRLFFEAHAMPERGPIGGIHPVKRGTYPASPRLQEYDLEAREFVEQAVLKQDVKSLLRPLGTKHGLIPVRPLDIRKALVHTFAGMLGHGVDPNRNIQILRGGPKRIVVRMGVGFCGNRKRRKKRALAPGSDRPFQLGGRLLSTRQCNMCNGHQTAVRVGTEVNNPAIIGTGIGVG